MSIACYHLIYKHSTFIYFWCGAVDEHYELFFTEYWKQEQQNLVFSVKCLFSHASNLRNLKNAILFQHLVVHPYLVSDVAQWTGSKCQYGQMPVYPLLPTPTSPICYYTSPLSQSVFLTCPCPFASSHFGKQLVLPFGDPGLAFDAVCVCLWKRHLMQSIQGTLYEPLGCVMFAYLACLPPIVLCVLSDSLCWPRCLTELMEMHTG